MTQSTNVTDQDIYVVTGLPRSGTSLMMSMLAAAGMNLLTDGLREADVSNPHGYYEYELVKEMKAGKTEWLQQARQRCVKIVSPLLSYLPSSFTYKIIFMQRNLDEVIASQAKMLKDNHQAANHDQDREMIKAFTNHLDRVKNWLAVQTNMQVFYVSYNELLQNPQTILPGLVDFLHLPLNSHAMLDAIDPRLYRNRLESKTMVQAN